MPYRKLLPGEILAVKLDAMPVEERKPFLAWLEQQVLQAGELETLREIRACRVRAYQAKTP